MLKPTIYIAPKDLCLLAARWRAAEAAFEAIKEAKESAKTEPGPAPRVGADPLVAV